MLECVGGEGESSQAGSVSGVSQHHMCYTISDNIPRCYGYRGATGASNAALWGDFYNM